MTNYYHYFGAEFFEVENSGIVKEIRNKFIKNNILLNDELAVLVAGKVLFSITPS